MVDAALLLYVERIFLAILFRSPVSVSVLNLFIKNIQSMQPMKQTLKTYKLEIRHSNEPIYTCRMQSHVEVSTAVSINDQREPVHQRQLHVCTQANQSHINLDSNMFIKVEWTLCGEKLKQNPRFLEFASLHQKSPSICANFVIGVASLSTASPRNLTIIIYRFALFSSRMSNDIRTFHVKL